MIEQWLAAIGKRLDAELLTAVCDDRIRRAKALLFLGADPDVTGWRVLGLVSALSAACIRANREFVLTLLASGADPDGSPLEPWTPLDRVLAEAEPDHVIADALYDAPRVSVSRLVAVRRRCASRRIESSDCFES
jgi:hypothetical protein